MIKTSPTNGNKSFVNLIERLSMKKLTEWFTSIDHPMFELLTPSKMNRHHPLPLMPQLRADREPCTPIDRLLLGR